MKSNFSKAQENYDNVSSGPGGIDMLVGNFLFPPPITLSPPPKFLFLPLVLNFGTRFLKFFLP
jgi:hypothetical protein